MKSKGKKIILFIMVIAVFSFLLIKQHKYTNIKKEELTIVTEIYLDYKREDNFYKINCESGNHYILTYILADDEHLEGLKYKDVLVLSLDGKTIIELEVNGEKIISIEDCHKNYLKQFKLSIIIIPSVLLGLTVLILFLEGYFNKFEFKAKSTHKKIKVNEVVNQNVYKSIRNSIYKKDGYLRCNILEQIESDEVTYTFYKAMIDYLNNREILVLIDDGCLDDGLALFFYKDNKKLCFEMIFRDGSEPFKIERKLYWFYPYYGKTTKEEQEVFDLVVEEYIKWNSELVN